MAALVLQAMDLKAPSIWALLVVCLPLLAIDVAAEADVRALLSKRLARFLNYGNSSVEPLDDDPPGTTHFAVFETSPGAYYGIIANISVHSLPLLNDKQISSTEIWVIGGGSGQPGPINVAGAGWHVYPFYSGDSFARFFTTWTADEYKNTGCYDRNCKGFVLDPKAKITPGSAIRRITVDEGPKHYITVKIFKDSKSENWWLYYGNDGELSPVGYWPKSLFNTLANNARQLHFGANIFFENGEVGSSMGSGHFPSDGDIAATFSGIKYINQDGSYYNPSTPPFTYVDKLECYKLGNFANGMFSYGGPSGCNN